MELSGIQFKGMCWLFSCVCYSGEYRTNKMFCEVSVIRLSVNWICFCQILLLFKIQFRIRSEHPKIGNMNNLTSAFQNHPPLGFEPRTTHSTVRHLTICAFSPLQHQNHIEFPGRGGPFPLNKKAQDQGSGKLDNFIMNISALSFWRSDPARFVHLWRFSTTSSRRRRSWPG